MIEAREEGEEEGRRGKSWQRKSLEDYCGSGRKEWEGKGEEKGNKFAFLLKWAWRGEEEKKEE